MRKSGPMEHRVIAAIALIGMAALSPAALAQEAPIASSVDLGDLFGGEDSVNLTEEKASELIRAARQAQAPGGCPLGALYIVTPAGDPLFQDAIASARRAAVVSLLNNAGIDVSRFFVDSMVAGTESNAWLSHDLDRERPTLATTSVPAKGTRVAPGDEITVTMVARDDAEPAHWQTGIKTMQLVADSEGGALVASENYEPCADGPPPPQRRVVATYIVPENPPPVVRLSALAEDHAGLMDTDAAEFPTGDWYGRVEWSERSENSATADSTGGQHTHSGHADFSLSDDGEGNLMGDLVGSQSREQWYGYRGDTGCTDTVEDTPITAEVIGTYTPGTGAMSIQFIDLDAKMTVSLRGTFGDNGRCDSDGDMLLDYGFGFTGLAHSLQPVGDGTYRAGWEAPGGEYTQRWSMTLRRTAE